MGLFHGKHEFHFLANKIDEQVFDKISEVFIEVLRLNELWTLSEIGAIIEKLYMYSIK